MQEKGESRSCMLSKLNEFTLFVAAILALLAAIEVGYRLGKRKRADSDLGAREHMKALQAALLGLLALLLGFNFALASSRFDARKALMQEEANAIGTAWERCQLLPPELREEMSRLLKGYVAARVDFMRADTDEERLRSSEAEASSIEARIWKLTRAGVVDHSGGSQFALFVPALNDLVNAKWKRRAVLDNHVPEPVLHLLLTVALGSLGFIGYGNGLHGQRCHVSTGIFALLIALVFATILDFDRPRSGFIRVSEEGFLNLQSAIDRDSS